MAKIKKIQQNNETVYPATILDAIKDASPKVTVNDIEVDNTTYGKTLREILYSNEYTTATALNELNTRVGDLNELSTDSKDSIVGAINALKSGEGDSKLQGTSGYTLGGLTKDTSIEGKTAAQVLDIILKPEYLPQFTDATDPTLTYNGGLSTSVEVGTVLPSIEDFTASAGSVAIAKAGNYSANGGNGTCTAVTISSNSTGGSAGSASTTSGAITYKVTCTYAQGTDEVKTNKGNATKYTSANSTTLVSNTSSASASHTTGSNPYYIASTTKSAEKTFKFLYRFYAATVTAGEATDQGLVDSLKNKELTLKGQGKQGTSAFFDVPPGMTISTINMYNPVSGKFESNNIITEFTTSTVTHTLPSGVSASYTRYAMNTYQDADFKIKLS